MAVVLIWLFVDAGGKDTPAVTVPPTTAPVTTTPTGTTTPTSPTTTSVTTTTATPPATGGTITVTLPAAGKIQPGHGLEVKTVQQALNQLGTAQLTVDGIYGPLTQQAVSAFQQANGLTVDGIVGPQTSQALNTALAAQG